MRVLYWSTGDPPEDLPLLAERVEALGYDGVALGDHLAVPTSLLAAYPAAKDGNAPFRDDHPWPDSLVAIAAMAARTTSLRFMTSVLVLPLRDPLVVAKAVTTAAVLSRGRVDFGVGVGWAREEFELAGQQFEDRGRRTDEALEILVQLRAGPQLEYHGKAYEIPSAMVSPSAHVPIYVGGNADRALHRAARYDGWVAPPLIGDDLPAALERIAALRTEAGRFDPFDVVCALVEGTIEEANRLRAAGATTLLAGPWFLPDPDVEPEPRKLSDWGEVQLRRFADHVVEPLKSALPAR